jgi:hypothetical protein
MYFKTTIILIHVLLLLQHSNGFQLYKLHYMPPLFQEEGRGVFSTFCRSMSPVYFFVRPEYTTFSTIFTNHSSLVCQQLLKASTNKVASTSEMKPTSPQLESALKTLRAVDAAAHYSYQHLVYFAGMKFSPLHLKKYWIRTCMKYI